MIDRTPDILREYARLAGVEWSDAELDALRATLSRVFEALERLEQLPLRGIEPTTQYRVL